MKRLTTEIIDNITRRFVERDDEQSLHDAYTIYKNYGFPISYSEYKVIIQEEVIRDDYGVYQMTYCSTKELTATQIENRLKLGFRIDDDVKTIKDEEMIDYYTFSRLIHHNVLCLSGNTIYRRDELIVKEFMDLLTTTQKRCAKGTQKYDEWLFYITTTGRLAKVMNNARKPIGAKLMKENKLQYDDYGILRANEVIEQGIIFKHRRLIDELDPKNRWGSSIHERLGNYFDRCKTCNMVIDRDFKKAYEPIYRGDFCLEGDLVTAQSCMSGRGDDAKEFYGGINGCSVVRFETDEGTQVGRCIMYEFNGIRHFIRIYCNPDYGNYCLRLLRAEMKETDLFGRSQKIPDMDLKTDWTADTPTMYLDGNYYAMSEKDDGYHIKTYGDIDLHDVSPNTIGTMGEDWCTCERCGERVHQDDAIWAGDCCYCCDDCAHEDGWYLCDRCGEWFYQDDGYFNDDYCWCDEHCMNNDGYYKCEECGEIHHEDYGNWINDYFYCCDDCCENAGYVRCDRCCDWVHKDDAIKINGIYYCDEDCAEEDGYRTCEDCGEWFKEYEMTEIDGSLYCDECAKKQQNDENKGE